ncbi:MAG: hypothetical protein GC136_07650 [Alphaproteobacteria bacterium]|nr:hypothetical protein [Alphaproteobacteria bacterium]
MRTRILARFLASAAVLLAASPVMAANGPSLVISDQPLPSDIYEQIYARPTQYPTVSGDQIISSLTGGQSMVAGQIANLQNQLTSVQTKVANMTNRLNAIETQETTVAASYYADVATINTQLQAGTTPGNPRLVARLNSAQQNLSSLEAQQAGLNTLSVEASNLSSEAAFLLESTRSAYAVSGALDEDHIRLAQIEDGVQTALVFVERLANRITDNLARATLYLRAETANLQTLSLGVAKGDLYGKSLSNLIYNQATANIAAAGGPVGGTVEQVALTSTPAMAPTPANPRPLAKIRFDRADVKYEESVNSAIRDALEKYPRSRYEIVAVYPSSGNAASAAIESSKARRNADKVLRSLAQMGLEAERVDITYTPSTTVQSGEVHIYVR